MPVPIWPAIMARRVQRALGTLFKAAGSKATVSRVWRKLHANWHAWCHCRLVDDDVVRPVRDGMVVKVRLDGYAIFSSFSLQTLDLIRGGAVPRACANVLAYVILGVGPVAIGHLVAARRNNSSNCRLSDGVIDLRDQLRDDITSQAGKVTWGRCDAQISGFTKARRLIFARDGADRKSSRTGAGGTPWTSPIAVLSAVLSNRLEAFALGPEKEQMPPQRRTDEEKARPGRLPLGLFLLASARLQ